MILRLVFLLVLFQAVSSYKVLVYSSRFGFSHMNFLGSIADALQQAGNEVTVLQPVINYKLNVTGVKLAKVIVVPEDKATIEAAKPFDDPNLWKMIWTINTKNPIGVIIHAPKAALGFDCAMKNVLMKKEVMDELRKEKFDLGIVEMFDYGGFPIFYELGIRNVVGSHSTVLTDRTAYASGLPILPSFVPPMQSAAGDAGDFWSRLSNTIFTGASWHFEKLVEKQAQSYMDEHHPTAPKIHDLISNMSFIFTNSEPFLDFPRPKLHKVVDIGGIGLKPAKNLDADWMKILSKRKKNVLISFGSMAPSSQMPQEFKDNIIRVCHEFPDTTFIWKYETPDDGTGNGADNVHLYKWTPQSDLLASGHLDLFVTHGGAGSILESAHSGVPMVAVPLFGDQHRNALMAQRFGYATITEKEHLGSFEEFKKAIQKGLTDPEVQRMAHRARDMLAAKPFSPQDLLVKHIDLAVKFGALPNLNPSGRKFNIVQYYNLDVYAVLLSVTLSILSVLLFTLKWCCCSRRAQKVKEQ